MQVRFPGGAEVAIYGSRAWSSQKAAAEQLAAAESEEAARRNCQGPTWIPEEVGTASLRARPATSNIRGRPSRFSRGVWGRVEDAPSACCCRRRGCSSAQPYTRAQPLVRRSAAAPWAPARKHGRRHDDAGTAVAPVPPMQLPCPLAQTRGECACGTWRFAPRRAAAARGDAHAGCVLVAGCVPTRGPSASARESTQLAPLFAQFGRLAGVQPKGGASATPCPDPAAPRGHAHLGGLLAALAEEPPRSVACQGASHHTVRTALSPKSPREEHPRVWAAA